MSPCDFTPEDDAALSEHFSALRDRIFSRRDFDRDKDLAEMFCLLSGYHDELIMRRQETRALVEMVDVLNAELRK